MGSEKYKLFREFMVEELDITKDTIRIWTQEAVATEVRKVVGQLNISKEMQKTMAWELRNRKDDVTKAIASQLSKSIRLTVKDS